jgi:hypothetical protein
MQALSTLTTAYDPAFQLGLGTYTTHPAAPLYTIDTGIVVLTCAQFSGGSPFTTGTPVSGEMELGLNDLPGGASSGAASMEVVPEPATLPLGGLNVFGGLWLRRFRAHVLMSGRRS